MPSFCTTSYQNFSSCSKVVMLPPAYFSTRSPRATWWWMRAALLTAGMP
jgi:hypothetical protein